jgi:hypothetical protein
MQNSFRGAGSQSPDLIFPGNLSVLRPPPGFEHIIPKGLIQQVVQQKIANSGAGPHE